MSIPAALATLAIVCLISDPTHSSYECPYCFIPLIKTEVAPRCDNPEVVIDLYIPCFDGLCSQYSDNELTMQHYCPRSDLTSLMICTWNYKGQFRSQVCMCDRRSCP